MSPSSKTRTYHAPTTQKPREDRSNFLAHRSRLGIQRQERFDLFKRSYQGQTLKLAEHC